MSPKEKNIEDAAVTEASLTPAKPRKKAAKIILPLVLLVLAVAGARHVIWSKSHEATDNAQIAADVVQIVPQVSGTVQEILVRDNELVKKGQLLVRLDDAKLVAAVNQARANLDAALADAESAGIAVEYTRASTRAGELQSSGSVQKASAGVGTAQSAISTAEAQYESSRANRISANADVLNAQNALQAAQDNVAKAKSAVESARAQLEAAKALTGSFEAAVRSAQAQNDLAAKNLERARSLESQGAVSKQQLDTAESHASETAAALDAALQQLASSKSAISQRQADLQSTIAAQRMAENSVRQASVGIDISKQKAASARANETAAKLQINTARQGLAAAGGVRTQSLAEARLTATAPIQVKQKEAARLQALAKVEQARAALRTAELDLEHSRIYAPADGRVSKRVAEVGALAQVGASLMSLVPDRSKFVVANFKETQVANIRAGEAVSIEVDAFPGHEFHGRVESTSAATGATFALLPPDNSTGNFVKVVQRVPVKIRLEDAPEELAKLNVGMSAVVTVKVR